jgi:hypothetical protein
LVLSFFSSPSPPAFIRPPFSSFFGVLASLYLTSHNAPLCLIACTVWKDAIARVTADVRKKSDVIEMSIDETLLEKHILGNPKLHDQS